LFVFLADHTNRTLRTPLAVTKIRSVPEPSSWMMMVAGFGILGGMLRAGRRAAYRVSFAD